MYQIHTLRKVHADPHPGNFLISKKGDLIALDFGCMKTIPMEFYKPYFELAKPENISNKNYFVKKLYELEILREDDSKEELEEVNEKLDNTVYEIYYDNDVSEELDNIGYDKPFKILKPLVK